MTKPLVSVLILAYNQEEYIADCLDSALAQQGDFDFEIVVAEDASVDGTLVICREYQRRYPGKIVLLSNQSNRGVVRNYF
ncbi:MAG TPA: glycosyltransferase, partial [Bacteroidales bacterium]|nr:glycosyltransferase [Bacteroidales bacterium]